MCVPLNSAIKCSSLSSTNQQKPTNQQLTSTITNNIHNYNQHLNSIKPPTTTYRPTFLFPRCVCVGFVCSIRTTSTKRTSTNYFYCISSTTTTTTTTPPPPPPSTSQPPPHAASQKMSGLLLLFLWFLF